ncbi:MAG: hypothetical protein AB1806_15695 [Acidobacteriota bacterium]
MWVRWAAAALVVIVLGGLALWILRRERAAPVPAADQAAASVPLGVRLTLVTGAPGEDAAAVVRVYNARARLGQTVQDAAAAGRQWKGTVEGADATPVQVQIGVGEWRASLTVERLDAGGAVVPVGVDALTIVAAPEGVLTFGPADTHTIVLAIRGDTVPPPGGGLRVRLTHAAVNGLSNRAVVGPVPSDRVEQLARSARVAELTRRFDVVAQRATEIITASPTRPVGYWYRGVALEATGDTAGALEAYQAAADRVTPGGQEPPVGLDLRIARLRAR